MCPIFSITFRLTVETPSTTGLYMRADDTSLDSSAARQAAFLSLQALCRVNGELPSRTVSDALDQPREWLAGIAQLGRVRAAWHALEPRHEVSQKALSIAAEMLHDVIEGLSR